MPDPKTLSREELAHRLKLMPEDITRLWSQAIQEATEQEASEPHVFAKLLLREAFPPARRLTATCATCRWWDPYDAREGCCSNPEDECRAYGVYVPLAQADVFGCTLHAPKEDQ